MTASERVSMRVDMKIALDIDGCISEYPAFFRTIRLDNRVYQLLPPAWPG